MNKKKIVTVSLLTLFAFVGNFLDNALFDKMDVTKNLIGSFTFGIVIMIILAIFYNPIHGQSEEFWKAIRKSVGKTTKDT
ncbi:MAG: hypothetical protein QM730_01875 [Anaerolineales bacterium]